VGVLALRELVKGNVGECFGAAAQGGRKMDSNLSSWVLMLISFLSLSCSFSPRVS
jgi:hypothetical protein